MTKPMYKGRKLRAGLADACLELWKEPIRDPEDLDRITELFKEIGWGWLLKKLGDGTYHNQPGAEYCGIGIAVAGKTKLGENLESNRCVPVSLKEDVGAKLLPGTDRMFLSKNWHDIGVEPPDRKDPKRIEKGDVVTVGEGRDGSHIVMALGRPEHDGRFPTVEFNSRGRRGDATYGKGCVRKSRSISEVCVVHRFGRSCFELNG